MRIGRTGTIVFCICMAAIVSVAGGQVIIQHVGANDPTTEGWTEVYYDYNGAWFAEARPLTPDPGFPEVDAWQIEQDSGEIFYKYFLSEEDEAKAMAQGFVLTGTWRMEWCREAHNFDGGNFIGVRTPVGWLNARMGYGDTTDQRSVKLLDPDWPDSPVAALDGDAYHTVKLVFDPYDSLIDLYVGDTLALENVVPFGDEGPYEGVRAFFGGANAGNANDGITDYSLVRFELGTGSGERTTGDADGDGDVDDDDLSLLLASWGEDTNWANGEFSGTPPVDDDDLSLLLANWTGAQLVPEPTMLALLGIGAAAVLRRRK